jgi:hypothetical protein
MLTQIDDLDETTETKKPDPKNFWESEPILKMEESLRDRNRKATAAVDSLYSYATKELRDDIIDARTALNHERQYDSRGQLIAEGQQDAKKSPRTIKCEEKLEALEAKLQGTHGEIQKIGAVRNDAHILDRLNQKKQETGPRPTNLKFSPPLEVVKWNNDGPEQLADARKRGAAIAKQIPAIKRKTGSDLSEVLPLAKAEVAHHAARFRLGSLHPLFHTDAKGKRGHIKPATVNGELIPGIGFVSQPLDSLAMLAKFFPDQLQKVIEADMRSYAERNKFISTSEAAKRLSGLRAELRELLELEEGLVRAGDSAGVLVARRQDFPLSIIFGFEKK